MKKNFCLTIVLLLSALSFLAQEKTIEKSEFDAIMKNRLLKFRDQSYRRTTRNENIFPAGNKNKNTSKWVTEAVPRGGLHSFYEFDSPSLKVRRETIMIDRKMYVREGDGEWTEKSVEEPKEPGLEQKFKTVEEQTEYKFLGTETVNNLKASVYAKTERKKSVSEADKREMLTTVSTKYWLDADGAIIKEEAVRENRFTTEKNPSGSIYRNLTTTTWEFDPNIRIEAPVTAK